MATLDIQVSPPMSSLDYIKPISSGSVQLQYSNNVIHTEKRKIKKESNLLNWMQWKCSGFRACLVLPEKQSSSVTLPDKSSTVQVTIYAGTKWDINTTTVEPLQCKRKGIIPAPQEGEKVMQSPNHCA